MKTRLVRTSAMLLVLIALALLGQQAAFAAPNAVCVSTGNGNWNVAATWSCNAVPTTNDIVIINDGHTVTLNTDGAAYQLIVGGGGAAASSLAQDANPRTLTVGAGGVTISSNGTLTAPTGGPAGLTVNGNTSIVAGGTLAANGTVDLNGDLSNSGTINAGSATIQIAGNASLGAFFNAGTSTVTLDGAGAQSLSSSSALYNLTVNKPSNNVTASSDLTVNNTLTLTSGDLDMASYTLTMGASATTAGNMDVIGAVKRTNPTAGAKSYGSQWTTLNFTADVTGDVTVTMIKQAPSGLGNQYVKRRYFISTSTTVSTTVRLHYRNNDLIGSPTESQLNLWWYDSAEGRWEMQNKTAFNDGTDDNWVEKFGVTTFLEWAIAKDSAPTAVTLSSFTAAPAAVDLVLPGLVLAVLGAIAGAWKLRRT